MAPKIMNAMKAMRFQLIIKVANASREGKFTVDVKRMDTVGKVKVKIWKLWGAHPKDQGLTFRGVGMVDSMRLEEYGIWRKVMVVLVLTENGINDMDMFKSSSSSSSSSSPSPAESFERELFG